MSIFSFNASPEPALYTLSLHDALPILRGEFFVVTTWIGTPGFMTADHLREPAARGHGVHSHSRTHPRLSSLTTSLIEDELRSEEHTSELQSRFDLVCRLLLEKKKHARP